MADSLKIQNLSLNDSQHAAPNGPPAANGRSAYIPPHLRSRPGAGPSPMDGAGPGPAPAPAGPAPAAAGPTPAGAWGNGYVIYMVLG